MSVSISAAPGALEHLREELGSSILRISFTTGCGGSGYRLASADEPLDGDTLVVLDGLRIALDGMAARRLDGAVIEWSDAEAGFVLDHPDAVTTVWCG